MFQVSVGGIVVSCVYSSRSMAEAHAGVYRDNGCVNVNVEVV